MFLTRARLAGTAKLAGVAAVTALVVSGVSAWGDQNTADAHGHNREPANIGQVKNDVKAYYGDYKDEAGHHHASDDSEWAKQTAKQVNQARKYLELRLHRVHNAAIVFDVDDTSEVTFGWEADNDFGYDPVKAEKAINDGTFVAIKPSLELANWAKQQGVKVYFVTGRPEHQRTATLKNLANEGFPAPDGAFLKAEGTAPDYLPCGLTCTTVEYKSLTRKHIESLGNTIVLNLGDQYSDLDGGHAEQGVKLPNPMYYLP